MSDAPERIWATEDAENYGEDRFHSTSPFKGGVEYIRADISEAAIAAARVEGERIGMERAAVFVESHDVGLKPLEGYVIDPWEPARGGTHVGIAYADAIRAAMDARPPQPEYPSDADIERSLRTARLLPDFLKPVDRP